MSEWISVKDRLPKHAENVIVTAICTDGKSRIVYPRYFWKQDEEHWKRNIIAWMPLPSPYKGG